MTLETTLTAMLGMLAKSLGYSLPSNEVRLVKWNWTAFRR